MTTNITAAMRNNFNAICEGAPVALFSCFVDGKPTAAIVGLTFEGDYVRLTPLFVAVTDEMVLTDAEGIPAIAGGAEIAAPTVAAA